MIVLNVGGNNKEIPLPEMFTGWEQHLLDIDPAGNPDICCDARDLYEIERYHEQYDAVNCSHNLEHYHSFDLPRVLKGFHKVTTDTGFVLAAVPNIKNIMSLMLRNRAELEDVLYRTNDGTPIRYGDVIFGWQVPIKQTGNDFFAHKWGFSGRSLSEYFHDAGFCHIEIHETDYDIMILARK